MRTSIDCSPGKDSVDLASDESGATCPVCGSGDNADVVTEKGRMRQLFTVKFKADRKCATCNSIWRMPCPRWAALVFASFGVLLCSGIAMLFGPELLRWGSPEIDFRALKLMKSLLFLFILGGASFVHGVRVLCGKAGRLRLMEDGRKDATSAT